MTAGSSAQSVPTEPPAGPASDTGALFESIVVHTTDAVLVTEARPLDGDAGGPRVVYVNPAFTRMTGFEAHEIVGRTPRIMQVPATDRGERGRLRASLEKGEPVEAELLNVRKDGVEIWVQLDITPVLDDAGDRIYWLAIQRDITERKQRDAALRSMLDSTSDLHVVADDDGDVSAVSASSLRVLGYRPEQLRGSRFTATVHAEDAEAVGALLRGSTAPRVGGRATTTARLRAADGSWRWFEMTAGEYPGRGTGGGTVIACADVTERRSAQEALEAANQRFVSAFDDAPIGMAITSLSGSFIQVNTALCDLLGRSPDELLALSMGEVTHADDALHAERQRGALLQGTTDRHRYETRLIHSDGTAVGILHSSSVVRDSEGDPVLLIDHVENITERQVFEQRLQHQALHDPLTGLPNRALFMDRLDRALEADQPAGSVAVLFCDIDRFKTINDTYGHPVGDLVLTTLAQRIQTVLRPADTVGRLGGDELAILCTGSGPGEAEATASALRRAMVEPISVGGAAIRVTISIGIALSAPGQTDAGQLLRDSDDAMYAAKLSGRGQCARHEVADARTNRRRLLLTAELPGAIADGELRLHFQPQVDLASREPTAMEALVRWDHPERGLLLPAEFLAVAEDSGLIRDLGRWVLEQIVLLQAGRRSGTPGGPTVGEADVVWLNVSEPELNDSGFAAFVEDVLRRHGVPGTAIGIEVTESVLMANLTRARSNLARLRSLGVHLAVDDFGTGYSSLSYVSQFPVDTVKIDGSFVAGLDSAARRRESFAVVSAVIGLAHSLGLNVIAEGIETPTQAVILHGLGCDQGQGYLYGKPRELTH